MQLCNFSNITRIIYGNIGSNIRINQVDFFIKLFKYFADENIDFDFDNGNVCRWMKGTRNISRQIASFYSSAKNKEHLSVDIEENILPMLTDVFKVADEVNNLVLNDTTLSTRKKDELTKFYPCNDVVDIADFLAECISFALERKPVKSIVVTKENDIFSAYNQLIYAIDNFKNHAEQIAKGGLKNG